MLNIGTLYGHQFMYGEPIDVILTASCPPKRELLIEVQNR